MPAPSDKAAPPPHKRKFSDEDLRFTLHDLAPLPPGTMIAGSLNGYPQYRKSLKRNDGSGSACMPGLGGLCVICGTGDCTRQGD